MDATTFATFILTAFVIVAIVVIALISIASYEKYHVPPGAGQVRWESRWSRVEFIGLLTLGLMVVGIIGTYLAIPEFHDWVKQAIGHSANQDNGTKNVDPPKNEAPKQGNKEAIFKKLYHYSQELKEGETFLDPYTGSALGISRIYSFDNLADGNVSLPAKETEGFSAVKPGTAWRFQQSGSTFSLVITKISRSEKGFRVDIREERK